MKASQAEDTTSTVISGGIHLIGKSPIVVHVYREHFLRNFVQRIPIHPALGRYRISHGTSLGKRPYTYAVIAENEGDICSLAHLLAKSHTVPTIAHFLAQLSRDCKLVTKAPLSPPRMVTDYSWVLLHATSRGHRQVRTPGVPDSLLDSHHSRCGPTGHPHQPVWSPYLPQTVT